MRALPLQGHPYTLYELRVTTMDGAVFTVEKRFSEFRTLAQQLHERHKQIVAVDGSVPPLPELPKSILNAPWFSGGDTLNPTFVHRREKALRKVRSHGTNASPAPQRCRPPVRCQRRATPRACVVAVAAGAARRVARGG